MNKPLLIQLFREMYELTQPICGCKCRVPFSCCSAEYCDEAIIFASDEWDVKLEPTGHPKLPLMGPNGCIAAPHLRPMCTLHTCGINGMGTSGDMAWDEKYFKLRDEITEAVCDDS